VGGPVPAITTQPVNVAVVASGQAVFSVAATGAEPIFYQWRRNGSVLPNASGATLILSNVQFSQAGNYTVLVYNENGSRESDPAMLTVLIPAQVLTQPTNRLVRIRPDPLSAPQTNVSFTVFASSTTPIRYQWRFNGVSIPGATNTSLTVTNVQLVQEGVYDAAITDGAGTIFSAPAYLQPLITPVVVRAPLSQNVGAGGEVTLSISISGHPAPFTYEWRRGSTGVLTNVTAATNNFYSFSVPTVSTSLTYRVVVRNLANPQPGVASSVATITVLPDTDNDGIPDAWEVAYNLGTNDVADAALDVDGDGMTNWEEYVAGTDPWDALSYLRIDGTNGGGGTLLSFGSVANKTYTVEYTEALGSGVWSKLADVPARSINGIESMIDPRSTAGRYYRLVTPRQP
jgi:hypothetical protein